MSYRDLSDTDLLVFAKTVESALVQHRVTAFDDDLADELASAIGGINTSFETSINNAFVAENVKQSAVAKKDSDRERAEGQIGNTLNYLNAKRGAAADYEVCGFKPPRSSVSRVVAQDPSELAAEGASNGVNTLSFKGNNKPGRLNYQIWRRDGRDGLWAFIGFTSCQRYIDEPVIPGQRYEYKIRAQASKTLSNYSNVAMVYGAP